MGLAKLAIPGEPEPQIVDLDVAIRYCQLSSDCSYSVIEEQLNDC